MHFIVRLSSISLFMFLASSSPDCGKKENEDDVVSLLQLPRAHEVQKGASRMTSDSNPFLMRANLVNKIENLKTWYNAKLTGLSADLAALDARFPEVAGHKNGSNATTLTSTNATLKNWWEYLLPPNYKGPVPGKWVPAAMRYGYQPWRDNAWKWLVYGSLASTGANKTMYHAWVNASGKGAMWPDPYGPFWGQGWKFWLPLVLTAKRKVEAKAITLKQRLDEEENEEEKATLHKRLVESAGELSELTSKYEELSAKAEGKEADKTEGEVHKSHSEAIVDNDFSSHVESESESNDEESPLGLSAPEGERVRMEPLGEEIILESAGSEKEQMQEESSPLGLSAAADANPEPAVPRQAGIDAPPILENAPTMSEAKDITLGGPADSLPDWPDLPGPTGPADADFEATGSTEADAYMGQSQYGETSQEADMAQAGAMADAMAGASDDMVAAAGDTLAANAMAGAQNGMEMMAGAQNGMGMMSGMGMGTGMMSKTVKGSILSGPHPAIPDAYLGDAMRIGYDPVRDTAWQRMLGVNLKQKYDKDGEKKEGI